MECAAVVIVDHVHAQQYPVFMPECIDFGGCPGFDDARASWRPSFLQHSSYVDLFPWFFWCHCRLYAERLKGLLSSPLQGVHGSLINCSLFCCLQFSVFSVRLKSPVFSPSRCSPVWCHQRQLILYWQHSVGIMASVAAGSETLTVFWESGCLAAWGWE